MRSDLEVEVERLKTENERYRRALIRLYDVAVDADLEEEFPLAVNEARTALEEGDNG
jgi:hypothetical protein